MVLMLIALLIVYYVLCAVLDTPGPQAEQKTQSLPKQCSVSLGARQ